MPPAGGGSAGTSTTAGAGGGSAGTSTTAGAGGTAGAACVNPPAVPNKVCADIPPQTKGDATFKVSSDDFAFCGEIPKAMTCDGNDFGTGASPKFTWTAAPAGTLSFAVVFKDISLSNDVATEKFGYHWAMWDIPPTVTGLPAAMTGGYTSAEVPGAHQWSSLTSYGFFTPCPNPFPDGAPQFKMCQLTQDSYSLTVYALKVAKLDNLPPAIDTSVTPNVPAAAGWNWVVNMGHYIESLDAVAVAEYRGTSKAWAKTFVPPMAAAFPCSGSTGSGGAGGSSAGGAGGASSGGSSAGGSSGSSGASSGGSAGKGGAGGSSAGGSSAGGSSAGGAGGASSGGSSAGGAGGASSGGSSAGGSSGAAMCLK